MIRGKKHACRLSWHRQSCLCSSAFVAPASRRFFGLVVVAVFRPPTLIAAQRCGTEVEFVAATFRWALLTWYLLRLKHDAANTKLVFNNSCSRKSPRQKFSCVAQNPKKHCVRQLARKCILLAGMIRRKKPRQIPRQLITRAMPKRKHSRRRNLSALFQQSQISPHRNAAQHKHRARSQNLQFALQKVPAIRHLRGQRLVRRRRATQSRGQVNILQSEPVFAIRGSRLIGKPSAKQRLVQKICGAISGEHSSGAIAAMRRGRESQNQKLGPRIAKSRNRLAPIIPCQERTALVLRNLFAIPYEARARAAADNFLIQFFQFAHAAVSLKSYHEPSQARQASKQHAVRALQRGLATIDFARATRTNDAARQSRRHKSQTLVVCGRIRSGNNRAQKTSESTDLHA
jgi:hypothetical protein